MNDAQNDLQTSLKILSSINTQRSFRDQAFSIKFFFSHLQLKLIFKINKKIYCTIPKMSLSGLHYIGKRQEYIKKLLATASVTKSRETRATQQSDVIF